MVVSCTLALAACKEDDFGTHSDLNYPIPVVVSVTENPSVGSEITIAGKNFAAPNTVSIDGISMTVTSETETEIKAVLPRIFTGAPIVIRNAYLNQNEENIVIMPNYPSAEEIAVDEWPEKIYRGRPLVMRGRNVDLVTEITIGDTTFSVNYTSQSPERLVQMMPSDLAGTSSKIVLRTVLGNTIESAELAIENKPDPYVPEPDLLLMDFEDQKTHFVPAAAFSNYTVQINREGIAPAPQGGNYYLSFYAQNIASNWDHLGSVKVEYTPGVDLIMFNDPHVTFLYNSVDNIGNFQFSVVQNGTTFGGYFAAGSTDNPEDAWTLRATKGEWQWVSARLSTILNENWTGNGNTFDPNGYINTVELILKQINAGYWDGTTTAGGVFVNPQMKLNIDQIYITDGPYLQYPDGQ